MKLRDIFGGKKEKGGLDIGLTKTKEGFFARIARAITGKTTIDAEMLDDIEETLIASDVGTTTTGKIIENLQERVKKNKNIQTGEIYNMLKEEMSALLTESNNSTPNLPDGVPYVIMVVGVNGVGKTTTIGKLANNFKKAGMKVVVGAP